MENVNPPDRFQKWLINLDKSLETIHSKEDLISLINTTVQKESTLFPVSLEQYTEALEDQISTSTSLREHLTRITYPKISLLSNTIIQELQSTKPGIDLTFGLQTDENEKDYEVKLHTLFEELNQSSNDPIIGFCKLADLCYRLDRAKNLDNQRLEKFFKKEESRKRRNEEGYNLALERVAILNGNDDSSLIQQSTASMSEEVQVLQSVVEEARKEEEEALRIYEAAKKKTKLAELSLSEVESSIDLMQVQASLLRQVNEIKLQLNKFNADSASNRLSLLSQLQQNISQVREEVQSRRVSEELPNLLNYLITTLQNMFHITSEANGEETIPTMVESSKEQSFFHSMRICKEAVKLFKKLTLSSAYESFIPIVEGLEDSLDHILRKHPGNLGKLDLVKHQNETVILYFSHVYHDTPTDHVEDQQRVETCIKLLTKMKVPAPITDGVSLLSHRALAFERCDKVKSPPFWCLTLVHSPQYLRRLYEYETEAKADDLYVPLEFDTEWESQYEFSSDSEPEEVRRKAQHLFSFKASDHWKQRLGDEYMDRLTNILKPREGDSSIANALLRKGKRLRGRRQQQVRSSQSESNNVDSKDVPVTTPYGDGVIIERNSSTGLAKVKLAWGAIATLNESSYIMVESASKKSTSSSDKFRRSISGAESNASHSSRPDTRFLYTDLRLHKLVTRILFQVKVQRTILEKVEVKDAHMSLWLHGRTSIGLSKGIEASIYNWLFNFNYKDLDELLRQREALDEASEVNNNAISAESNTFMRELGYIKRAVPFPASTTADEYFGDSDYDNVELRKEAFEYSTKRLINKSGLPRANGPRNRNRKKKDDSRSTRTTAEVKHNGTTRKRKYYDRERKFPGSGDEKEEPANEEKASSEDDQISSTTVAGVSGEIKLEKEEEKHVSFDETIEAFGNFEPREGGYWKIPELLEQKRQHRRKEVSLGYFKSDDELRKTEELLQSLLVILMRRLNWTQTDLAEELWKRFHTRNTQTSVSAWFHFRSSNEYSMKVTMEAFLIAFSKRSLLQSNELIKFQELVHHRYFQFILQKTTFVLNNNNNHHHNNNNRSSNNAETATSQSQSNQKRDIPPIKTDPGSSVGNNSSSAELTKPQHRLLKNLFDSTLFENPAPEEAAELAEMQHSNSSDHDNDDNDHKEEEIKEDKEEIITVDETVEEEAEGKSEGSSIVEDVRPTHSEENDDTMSIASDSKETEEQPSSISPPGGRIKLLSFPEPPELPKAESSEEEIIVKMEVEPSKSGRSLGRPPKRKPASGNASDEDDAENKEKDKNKNEDDDDDDAEENSLKKKVKYNERSYMKDFDGNADIISAKSFSIILNDFIDEMERRELSHSYVSRECIRLSLTLLSQPLISKFVRLRSNPYLSKGNEFLYQVIRWLLYSQRKQKNYANEDRASCSECGETRAAFRTKTDFLNHVGFCSTIRDRIKPIKQLKQFLINETPTIDECREKLSNGDLTIIEGNIPLLTESPESIPAVCNHCLRIVSTIPTEVRDIQCHTCSVTIHTNCASTDSSDHHYCLYCTLLGLSDGEVEPITTASVGQMLFVYINPQFGWRKSLVLAQDPVRENIVLIKILSSVISNISPYHWIDLKKKKSFLIPTSSSSNPDEDDSEQSEKEQNEEEEAGPKRKRRRTRESSVKKEIRNNGDSNDDIESEDEVPVRRRRGRKPRSATTQEASAPSSSWNGANGTLDPPHTGTVAAASTADGMTDTYVSANSLKAALCAAGTVCKGIDIVMSGENTNAFACIRPPGHHCGRNGCTKGSLSTGFCLLNNAAIGLTYARVFWGVKRIAIVDIDVHYGNGTAEIVRNDPETFFASVQMIYGPRNDGNYQPLFNKNCGCGFYPSNQGITEITNNYVSVGIYPSEIFALECSKPQRSTGMTVTRNSLLQEYQKRNHKSDDDNDGEEDSAMKVDNVVGATEEEKGIQNTTDSIELTEEDNSEIMSIDENNEVLPQSKEKVDSEIPAIPILPCGSEGYLTSIREIIIPKLRQFEPELLIISAGFDGYVTDPLGGELNLTTKDFHHCTRLLMESMEETARIQGKSSPKIISILEGGYDTAPETLGLAKCVEAHVKALLGI